ncbi:MAG TPA: hypothetical protein VF226_09315 [Hyphomicrobiaceae bacterium]|jgi:ElaB/YqjD/DUF883 family membrane-anchored ribosome-binding protein
MVYGSESVNEAAGKETGDIGAKIEELRAEMMRLSEQVQVYLQNRAGDLKEDATETSAEVQKLIRENPFPAVGVALGIGFLLGLMMRGGASAAPRLSRRDFDRLASKVRGAIEAGSARAQAAASEVGDTALLERLAGALSSVIGSSRSAAESVGSAGGRAAKSVAAVGERTARNIAERLSQAAH